MSTRKPDTEKDDPVNRRQHPRIKTSSLVTYVCIDEDGNEVAEGFGSALDLSMGGIKMQTREQVETPYVLLLAIDLEGQPLEVKGRVVYSRKSNGEAFMSGIRFVDTEDKHLKIITNFVKAYRPQMKA